ncbi:hypothetical protein ACFFIX_19730 [Metabacillus herbersteinensis]|uniref:YozE SAM-like domain-containing protein n=1 Tax=Metabacillus herbersteinensis TaxID=283816 RepID=A0ABV6GIU9_9BACI
MKKPIAVIQADNIFKALYYTARNEGIDISEDLTEIYEILAEHNPSDTHVTDTLDVMEYLSEFLKSSCEYQEYFAKEDACEDYDDEMK